MANEQKEPVPVYIDLTWQFNTYGKIFTAVPGFPAETVVTGTVSKQITFNANNIVGMMPVSPTADLPNRATYVTTVTGDAYDVHETIDEIKQKTTAAVAALKP